MVVHYLFFFMALTDTQFVSKIWAAQCENVPPGICGQRRPRSACASAQSDQGPRWPQTEPMDTAECMTVEQMPG